MNIGIIGSGNGGSTLGKLWAKAGHQVMFSFSRDLERLQTLAAQIGPNAMSGTQTLLMVSCLRPISGQPRQRSPKPVP